MKTPVLAATLALALAACTSPPESTGAASTGGPPNICINPANIQKQTIVSDEEIRFEMRNGDVFVNKLSPACHGLKFEGGFSWQVRGSTVCGREQIIEVLNTGNTCVLGNFTREPAKT